MLLLLLLSLVWFVKVPRMIWDYTKRIGPYIQKTTGTSIFRQVLDQTYFALLHSVSPREYYAYGMFTKGAKDLFSYYVYDGQALQLLSALNPQADISGLVDKRKFSRLLSDQGLPSVCTVAWVSNGQFRSENDVDRPLPPADLFVKPSRGSGGRGALLCQYAGVGEYLIVDGDLPVRMTQESRPTKVGLRLNISELMDMLVLRGNANELMVQRRLLNHPDIDIVPGGALSSLRILTGFLKNEIVYICAVFTIGDSGSIVSQSGLSCGVDEATGEIGCAVAIGEFPLTWTHHPVSGAQIKGRRLPMWRAAKKAVLSAHRSFAEHPFVAWDVALSADGVFILEGNHGYGTENLQKPFGRPLLKTRYLDVIMYWLNRRGFRGGAGL